MNERAVRLLVGLLERWVEEVQEELHRAQHLMLLSQQMGRLHLTAAPAQHQQQHQQQSIKAQGAPAAVTAVPIITQKADSSSQGHRRTASAAGSIDGDDDGGDDGDEAVQEPIEVAA
jgi:hypothetical protein